MELDDEQALRRRSNPASVIVKFKHSAVVESGISHSREPVRLPRTPGPSQKILNHLHSLHRSLVFIAQAAVQIFFILIQTYTAVICGKFVDSYQRGEIHHQAPAGAA